MSGHNEYQEKIWNQELALYTALKNGDYNNELVVNFEKTVNKAIGSEIVGVISCMDDRLSTVNGTLRIAGSGILLAREIGFENLAKLLKSLNGKKLTTHNDCGAAGLYAKAENILDDEPDEVARKIVDEFSKEHDFEHEYIGNIDNPHAARSIFVDTTARLNPSAVSGLPEAFVVTEKFIPTDHVLAQINVAISIATGSHGFGEKISPINPFFIFVLGENGDNKELDNGLKLIKENNYGKVEIKYISLEK